MTIETILPTPDVFSAKRVLCVQPHYDDNDIAAGGTLARLRSAGAEIFYLTVTNDLMGVVDASLSSEGAEQALKRDQFAAGKIIGVQEQYWLGFPDAGEYDYFAVRRNLILFSHPIPGLRMKLTTTTSKRGLPLRRRSCLQG
jgi:LmbE family N-acetylglucosaminyl deacetylase